MREYDSEEALMQELGSGLEVPMQEHECSSEALMRELGSDLEVPTQEHDSEVLTRELGSGLEVPTREHVMLRFHRKHGFAV